MTYDQRKGNRIQGHGVGIRGAFQHSLRKAHCLSLLGVSVVALFSGCQTTGNEPPKVASATSEVTLSAGDQVKITFTGAPELNQLQKIRADGKISLPLVGEVKAAGKTLPGLQNELTALYKPQLKNSDLLVTLENGTGQVVVSGAVGKPGKLSFDRPTTVFQAIMEAGGASQYGNLRKVRLVRIANGEQQSQVMDLTGTLKGQASQVVYVRDGDVIYVPQSAF